MTVFADWNDDNIFEAAELIYSWEGVPPFNFAPNDPDFTIVTTPWIDVAEDYATPGKIPKFRLRLTYYEKFFGGERDMSPGGHNEYGEVEDFDNEPIIED